MAFGAGQPPRRTAAGACECCKGSDAVHAPAGLIYMSPTEAPPWGFFVGCAVGYVAFNGLIWRTVEKCHDKKTMTLCVSARMNRNLLRGTLRGMIGQKRKNPK